MEVNARRFDDIEQLIAMIAVNRLTELPVPAKPLQGGTADPLFQNDSGYGRQRRLSARAIVIAFACVLGAVATYGLYTRGRLDTAATRPVVEMPRHPALLPLRENALLSDPQMAARLLKRTARRSRDIPETVADDAPQPATAETASRDTGAGNQDAAVSDGNRSSGGDAPQLSGETLERALAEDRLATQKLNRTELSQLGSDNSASPK